MEEMTTNAAAEAPGESPISIPTGAQKCRYDIFLSFRGKDTRHTFTGYLYNALCERGFKTFMDDEGLESGEEISPVLIKAIEESKVSIVIFSENYASSSWCLNELVKILQCKREKGQMVWPIFYKIDPSDVRYQRNGYKEAMSKHENTFKNDMMKVKKWRTALNETANLSGWTFKTGYEYKLITDIIQEASSKLHRKRLYVGDHIIGLKSRLEEVKSLLDIQCDDTVRMLGIHGIGGIGKTTLAKVLYNSIIDHFDGACFLEFVRERSNGGMEIVNVQEKLLAQIFGKTNFNFGSVDEGAYMIKHSLSKRRVLIVLDDVDKKEQLEKLAGGCDWFGPGSRIIITTRDTHLLIAHGIETIYAMKMLGYYEAVELFCWKAFKRNQPDGNYVDISHRIIDYAKGLPLALKIIGSNLFGRSIIAWESALNNYQGILDKNIQDVLRVSYDSLEDDQKNIFLDIVCFFNGKRLEDVENILDACYLSPQYNIKVLVDKSLISMEYGKLGMHDLIQDMGKEVVRQDASSKLGQYSRLWNHEDILNVLTTNSGTDSIQAIMFHPLVLEKMKWCGTAFEKMNHLRMLVVRNAEFSISPKSLPSNLRVLEWDRYPSESLPEGFCPRKIVILKLPNGHTVSLMPLQKFENLTCMDFSNCQQLTQIPDVSGAPNIRDLKLEGCTNLKEIHDSVGGLTKLLDLSLEGCTSLEIFPRGIQMTSLRSLNFNDCRSLQHFPDILEQMDKLKRIEARWTGIKQIPDSICYLPGLEVLSLAHNDNLVSIPESINKLDRLKFFNVDNCRMLQQITGVPSNLRQLQADGCISLTSESSNALWTQALREVKDFSVKMPISLIPNWFDRCCKGRSLSFWVRNKFPFFAVAFVFSKTTSETSSEFGGTVVKICCYNNDHLLWSNTSVYVSNGSGVIIKGLPDNLTMTHFNSCDWNHVEIKCSCWLPDKIDECGIYVYKQGINMEDIQFECPIPNNSNMYTVMSRDDTELRAAIEEAKLRKRSRTGYMSRNNEKIEEVKPRKKLRKIMSRNDKQIEADKLQIRFIKKSQRRRIKTHTVLSRHIFPPLFFSKFFKLSSSFHSI